MKEHIVLYFAVNEFFFKRVKMFKYLQILAILSTFFHCCLPQRRIFHGTDAKPKQFPYMAIIMNPMVCGGALLNNK